MLRLKRPEWSSPRTNATIALNGVKTGAAITRTNVRSGAAVARTGDWRGAELAGSGLWRGRKGARGGVWRGAQGQGRAPKELALAERAPREPAPPARVLRGSEMFCAS